MEASPGTEEPLGLASLKGSRPTKRCCHAKRSDPINPFNPPNPYHADPRCQTDRQLTTISNSLTLESSACKEEFVHIDHRLSLALIPLILGASLTPPPANKLALTPPMGWNSWNHFGCNVSDSLIRGTADAMVSSGMRSAGYQYVVIDDCWQVSRDSKGTIVADSARFPHGMKALADYVHSKGLRFGIYTDAGTKTCQGRPGSFGYEDQDARTYAAWGVDYVKEDWCNASGLNARTQYAKFRKALDKTGRPIVLSICEWGSNQPWEWAPGVGNLWRTTDDIEDKWVSML